MTHTHHPATPRALQHLSNAIIELHCAEDSLRNSLDRAVSSSISLALGCLRDAQRYLEESAATRHRYRPPEKPE